MPSSIVAMAALASRASRRAWVGSAVRRVAIPAKRYDPGSSVPIVVAYSMVPAGGGPLWHTYGNH